MKMNRFMEFAAFSLLFVVFATIAAAEEIQLLNVSYDPTRELYQEFNPIFVEHWKQKTGQDLRSNSRTAAPENRPAQLSMVCAPTS